MGDPIRSDHPLIAGGLPYLLAAVQPPLRFFSYRCLSRFWRTLHRRHRLPASLGLGHAVNLSLEPKVMLSPIGANSLTVGAVQSKVELTPAAAYSLGMVLL